MNPPRTWSGLLERRLAKRIDIGLLLAVAMLVAGGLIAIYSATTGTPLATNFVKQITWLIIAAVPAVFFAVIDPLAWARRWRFLYLVNCVLLAVVLFAGDARKGAQRWIEFPGGFQFQPSEVAKVFVIFTLAALLTRKGDAIKSAGGLLATLAHIVVPMLLIFRQPDLGTALVILAVWFGMVFVAGARAWHLAVVLLVCFAAFFGAWNTGVIKQYQKDRLVSFVNPDADSKATGYHIRQARIAVGSGRSLGKGYGQGTQKKGRFIPEQHTDFIFTVVGEEGGFVGSLALVAAFGLLLWRVWLIIANATSLYYRYVATGVFAMLLFHVFVNIGMVTGLSPVVGVPLPFISYGGTITIVAMSLTGLLLGIRAREEELVF